MRSDRPPRLAPPEFIGEPVPPGAHDVNACFAEEDLGTVDGFTSANGPDGVTVRGWCPRCQAKTSFTFQVSARDLTHRPGGRRPESPASDAELATVYCACGHPHPGRPGGSSDTGCGAYWKVTIR